jgi:hypothetical protein|nr:MAG TPA: minor capsid protein [Caudoviricetes sp.]
MQLAEYDLGEAFAAIENELIASMMRNISRHKSWEKKENKEWTMWQVEQLKELEKFKKENQAKYPQVFKNLNWKIEELLRMAEEEGQMDQEAEILQAIKDGFPVREVEPGATAEFFKLNSRKLEALIQATNNDMQKAETAVLRMAEDQYRKIIYNAQVYANTGAGTYEKAIDMATRDFLAAGLTCIEYKNGARHTLSDYADMAIRTASKRAYLQGEGVKRQEWKISTVIINKRGDNPCPKCLPFVGKVMIDDVWSNGPKDGKSPVTGKQYPLISSAIAAGLYHPRCRDSHTTYFEGISTPPDGKFTKKELNDLAEKNRIEAQQQYAERQTEKYGRLAQYSLDSENQKNYRAKEEEWESQAYRSVIRGESSIAFTDLKQTQKITIKQVGSYSKVYISDMAKIKPRALHTINRRTEKALKEWKVPLERKPKIIIVSPDEMPTAYGKYDAIQDAVFYIPQITDRNVIKMQGDVEFHEMWHMKQAENFRKRYGEITKENYDKYIKTACKDAKRTIDRIGITKYNVSEISDYAKEMYARARYDEVEAEYMTINRGETTW